MGNSVKIDVTYFKPRGLLKKAIGTHIGADGKPKTTVWWLGRHQGLAVEKAELIQQYQQDFRRDGMGQHWTEDAMTRIKQAMKRFDELKALRVEIARETIA